MKVEGYQDIKIGKHGIILNKLNAQKHIVASAVFLPQVPLSYGWSLETTLGHLSNKAGLAWTAWKSDCVFEVFEGYEIKE
jgi:AMMECR1 domain-containing protein